MKANSKASVSVLACCIAAAIGLSVHAAPPAATATAGLSAQDLVYSYDEMFDFDIDAWLARRAPHLSRHGETISHWAGYSGVSPKVLIALMEQQSGVVTRRHARADAMSRPFGSIGRQRGFGEQTREVALALREAMYEPDAIDARGAATLARTNPLQSLFARSGAGAAGAAMSGNIEFQQVYAGLFNEPRRAAAPSPRFAGADASVMAGPANGFLQFPFPRGQSWHVGGAHTTTGSGSYPMSSLDMSQGGGWGSYQGDKWVSASAGGSFKRHSSCFAEVVHGGGWSTSYYHLMNIRYGTGASVSANTAIANPANTQSQALCNGGASTGPHQHWSLKYNGSHYHLNGVYLSGFQITAISNQSYDTNCSRFYLSKNGNRYCAGYFYNP
ncbi:beta-lytic metalloendopeptidase [Lysobacter maris]|uniref:Beta-lytic metalloendopeptidase n=1 Tax=Marilutibacter maris TaxID=1605891 RepID=A0A508BBT1_9GAMM|nr:M23 family metallopeptidase [Lysobacter maris]KAB8198334.1 beta-lytic metalloendopeptidase [Lysobacter maris]